MKKLLLLLLTFALTLALFTSCSLFKENDNDETVIRIGYMQGPTGMGMAKLIHDNGGVNGNAKYTFVKYENAALAQSDLLANKIDMACLPTNNAAVVYNKQNAPWKVLALNCLNSLYVLTREGTQISSLEDLEGKTVYTISSGTPKAIFEHLLKEKNINATVSTKANIGLAGEKELVTPDNLKDAIINGEIEIALAPEPVATAAPLAAAKKGFNYTTAINLTDAWSGISESPVAMGCIVANADFINAHKAKVDAFLDEYKASIEFVADSANRDTAAQYIVDAAVMGDVGPAKKSLANLGAAISYVDGDAMKKTLTDFYNAIGASLTGGKLPNDEFYYKK